MAESAVNDFCRLCKVHLRKGDRLQHTKKIYEREAPDNKSIFQRLASVGLLLLPQQDKSFRTCNKCYRLVKVIEESLLTLRRWKLAEGTGPAAAKPREEEESGPAAKKPKEEETGPAAIQIKEEETGPAAIQIKEEETGPAAIKIQEEETGPAAIQIKEETGPAAIKIEEEETGPAAKIPKEEEETGPAAIKIKEEEETVPEPAASGQPTTTTPQITPTPPQTEKRSRESPSKTPQTVKRPWHPPIALQTPWTLQTHGTLQTPGTPETVPRQSKTTVKIQYRVAKSTTLKCPTSAAGIVENIAKEKWSRAANLIMKHDMLLNEIKESVLILLDDECKRLCHPKQEFMLFRCSPDDLTAFSFAKMESDLQRLAPFLFSLLSTTTNHSPLQTCAAAAILLRGRQDKLPSAFAYYINSVLHHGGAKKAVFERLCKFGISTNHNTAVRKQRSLADVHVVMQFSSSGFGLFIEGDDSELQPPVSALLEHLQVEGE